MGYSVNGVLSSWWLEAPRTAVTTSVREGVRLATGLTATVASAPLQAIETVAEVGAAGLSQLASTAGFGLREDLAALVDPHERRSQRRLSVHEDHAQIEVRGLTSERSTAVVRALERQLRRSRAVRSWRVNAITGRVATEFTDAAADLPELLDSIAEAEAVAEVEDQDWHRGTEFPADREPLLAAGIQVAGDVGAIALSTAGRLLPLRGPARALRAAATLADTQPRVRGLLEQRLGRPRTDLVLALANAVGNALSDSATEGLSNLLVDTAQRSAVLVEALARRSRWQQWEQDLCHHCAPVAEPLPPHTRAVPIPPGPIERVADEIATGSILGAAAAAAGGRGLSGATDALELGAPKAARATREAYATTVSTLLSRSGVLTMHPAVWRRLDRLSALVIDAEALLTERRVVLEAVSVDDEWPVAKVWSTAQRLLWSPAGADPHLRLVHPESGSPDRGPTRRPVWRELRERDRSVGRILIGRELDRRAYAVLTEARAVGLRITLVAGPDAAELSALADEFVAEGRSLSKLVHGMQQDGHVVAVLSSRAHKALAWADVAIGLADQDSGMPWTADAVCRDLDQVRRILAAVGPARQVSERGRSLALSAGAIGALLLATAPTRRGRVSAMTAAHYAGLMHGAFAGWRSVRGEPGPTPAPLLPWHALEPGEVLGRLPEPDPIEQRPAPGAHRAWLGPLAATASFAHHLRRELADPLTPILGVGAVATAILGAPSDALLLTSVLTVNAVVSARQRSRAEGALHQLLAGEQLTGRLIDRAVADDPDAATTIVPAGRLAIGDVLVLRPGDVVPADARLLRADELELDESGLTGESVSVQKQIAPTPGAVLGDRACMVFEGSTIVNGTGVAVIVAVGDDTQAGRATAGAMPPEKGGVQAQLRRLTDRALPLTLAGGSAVTGLGLLRGRLLRTAIADGVAVAIAAVPEGLPLVATVAQLAASRRLSRHGVLVRASRTVEALGRVDTLCFDKTGTLTEGKLRLTTLADLDGQWTPDADSEAARRLLRAAARACPDPAEGPVLHATDRAVLDAAETLGEHAHRWDPVEEIPFESNRGYAAALGHTRRRLRLVVKGAPEIVFPRCRKVRTGAGEQPFDGETRARADRTISDLAGQGLRVLVVARRDLTDPPEDVESAIGELTLLGFVGLADTARPQTLPMVTALQHNGIGVRMITGDHPETAVAVAKQLGIDVGSVTTGADLDRLDDSAQAERIEASNVFARVTPQQKVRIVAALRKRGHVVGMTGDGTNDAAAIRTADVGIGLAARGSAAARNAADLVLTDPDPLLLLHALIEGRGMWQRVGDAVGVLVGGNAGEVAFTMYGTAVNGKAPLGTRQFLLVNMLTDMFPAMALALSPNGASTTEGPAQDRLAAIPPAQIGSDLLHTIAVRGVATAAGASVAWTIGRYTGTQRRAATIGLVALIGTQLGQTLISGSHSPLVWLTTAASAGVLGAVVMTPGLCTYFGCRPLGPLGWSIAGASAAAATIGAAVLPPLLARRTAAPEDVES